MAMAMHAAPGQQGHGAKPPEEQSLTAAVPIPSGASGMRDVEVDSVPTCAIATSLLFFPLLPLGKWYTVDAKTATATLHCGVLTRIDEDPGCHWTWPCGAEQHSISTKQRTLELSTAKVADGNGNPVNVSAIINFRVVDPKKAMLNVEHMQKYVDTNAQAVLKQTVSHYTYDRLKEEYDSVNETMRAQLQPLLVVAGVEVASMCLNDLSYAPEVAAAMLKKQQASALIEARTLIVEGACRIAQDAVGRLQQDGTVDFTDDQKVKIITNLLTVTCSETDATPTLGL